MKVRIALLLACVALLGTPVGAFAQGALERARKDEVTRVPADNAAMADAFRKARAGLHGFLKLLDAPPPGTDRYAIKLLVSDAGENEYFWISNLKREGDRFSGTLDNTPRLVKNVRQGQTMRFGREDIVDWMYVDSKRRRMMGNFTLCALLTLRTPQEAAEYKQHFGLVCD
jgi:uncharacterized protein YegJ (DUF2314 family)